MTKKTKEKLCHFFHETAGHIIKPGLIDHILIADKGIIIRMKAGYSRNVSVKHFKQYFGDKHVTN